MHEQEPAVAQCHASIQTRNSSVATSCHVSAGTSDGEGHCRGELFTSFSKSTAPKFGRGLPPMRLNPPKEGPSSLTSCKRWSDKQAVLMPRAQKPDSQATSHLGPGQYEQPRLFDGHMRRSHATMGLAPSDSLFRQQFSCRPPSSKRRLNPGKVHRGTWSRSNKLHSASAAGPGPGSYEPCTTSFCACNRCGAVSQGKTFGIRPATYTGQVEWPAPPGPGQYHVDCTTIGAATQMCNGSKKRT